MWIDAANTLAPSSPTLPTSVGVGIVCAYIVHAVKKLKEVPWINFYSVRLNTAIRAVTSFASTIGVSVSWSAATHTLTIGNITLAVVVSGLYHWAIQYGVQDVVETQLQSKQISLYRAQQEQIGSKVPTV